ncbi:LysR family transcriptional regulator [Clostridium transplantifaecale]|uniref:LysR family transcriptional regulator n=1 Tax=Clostridium transplantifaecale TaxID=2479838 RepID=UPI0013DE3A2A|nr:LysR family transcriptional regulator [Clostridium transplantifaecale]
MRDTDWEILSELYKNPNMTKVANLFYMTQPALTKRLKQMEEEFQVAIVNRTPHGLKFTPEGAYLAGQAGLYLQFIKETRDRLALFRQNCGETITIGSSYTYSKYMLSDILFQYRNEHPGIRFNVLTDQSGNLFRKVLDGSVDVGFIRGDYEGGVNRILVGHSEACLVTKEPVDFGCLPAMQRIDYKTNDRTMELLSGWWQEHYGEPLSPGMEVGYIDVAWQMIHRGFGYTLCFLPENFVNEYNLCLTPLKNASGLPVIRNTWFFYPKSKRLSDSLEQFIRYIEREQAFPDKQRKEINE